jgi:hypothetical protein
MTTKFKGFSAFFLLFCISSFVVGQSLSMDVMASSGNEVSGEESSLSWTIGENFIEIYEDAEGIQTLGFHQTYIQTDKQHTENPQNSLWIYPNPVLNTLNIQSKEMIGNAIIQIFSITGELVLEREVQMGKSHQMDLPFLNEGSYHLRIINHKIQHFTFIKRNL